MDKLKMQTANKADENFKKLAAMFPNAVTETIDETTGEVVRAIDKDVLMQEINTHVVDGKEERYQFTWPDKKKSVLLANSPIAETLRPCRDESVDFDNTENLYIEGDNLDVLKLLQETYLGKVKMIYIDPPYNTGNDFVYNDDFSESIDDFLDRSGQFDEDGNRLFHNTESNGRFHTDWLNMIYPRLKIARNLLSDDGVIFISIDDNEQENLKKICDEILGAQNFVAQVIWERAFSPINLMKHFSPSHDYILCYAKNIELAICNGIPRSEEANDRYSNPDNDPRGVWSSSDISVGPAVQENVYPITTPSGRVVEPPAATSWRLSKNAFLERLHDNRIWFGPDGNGVPRIKRFLSELKKSGITPMTIWKHTEVDHSQGATQKLAKLFDGKKFFDYPKSVELIKRCLQLYSDSDCYIIDFFSGSATTAHAVMQLNAEDGGHRKFIMVQLPEKTDEKSEAFKAGYKNICEIGKERIRRAGKKIKAQLMAEGKETRDIAEKKAQGNAVATSKAYWIDSPEYKSANKQMASDLDTGFRVLKLDSTNMKEVYYNPAEITIDTIMGTVDNIKEDRTPEDLLFQVMLDLGVLLSSKIEKSTIGGKTVFNVEDSYLIACFDDNVTDEVITAIAKQKPYYFVMRDSSMANDSVATNFEQIFAAYSPDTVRKVL
ncbi:site-specific DNA-methyltransferase [Ruminococcus sp.]|uniref:site-specific DNA-methyltransferase n=1 Tax=Ruminococcus sp. TaxID=41978 RepID=UPI0039A1A92A